MEVSIHAPVRGATSAIQTQRTLGGVSIHAPVRGATHVIACVEQRLLFQSTRPCGARPRSTGASAMALWFQSTRPCGARPDQPAAALHPRADGFNPRARAGRDGAGVGQHRGAEPVSIHAPVRGATTRCGRSATKATFQSTRPCGARPSLPAKGRMPSVFQSTRPCGARPSVFEVHRFLQAPFQSTRPCGARLGEGVGLEHQAVFQSTRPCGARQDFAKWRSIHHGVFQSTRPCGARPSLAGEPGTVLPVSIHAPVRGATTVA